MTPFKVLSTRYPFPHMLITPWSPCNVWIPYISLRIQRGLVGPILETRWISALATESQGSDVPKLWRTCFNDCPKRGLDKGRLRLWITSVWVILSHTTKLTKRSLKHIWINRNHYSDCFALPRIASDAANWTVQFARVNVSQGNSTGRSRTIIATIKPMGHTHTHTHKHMPIFSCN